MKTIIKTLKNRSLNARSFFFLLTLIILFAFLSVRVIDLQIVHGQTYLQKAEDNRFYAQRLPARRGILLDRYHEPLVWNIQKYFRVINPGQVYEKTQPIEREEALKVMTSSESGAIVTATERLYRYPQSLAHALGYVGDVTAEDLQRDPDLLVGTQIGKAGLELQYERELRGIDGRASYEVNAMGQKQRLMSQEDPQAGSDIVTTLDPYLTEVAMHALGDQRGAVVITDARTGKILALTSRPSFDPNVMTQQFVDATQEAARRERMQQFFLDPLNLFFDRAVAGVYPPGSIFKIVTSLAGLENSKIDESTTVVDEGVLKVGEFEYGNWYFSQYGRVEGAIQVVRAIARSNDIFFYKVAEWTGPEKLAEMARLLGLGKKTGVDLPTEAKGLIPDPDWKIATRGERWFLGNTYHMGIGQGDILTSPIQIAQMTQAVANNGSLCRVSFRADTAPDCHKVNLKDDDMTIVLRGMIGACSQGGTAFPFFPYNAQKNPGGPEAVRDSNVQQFIDDGVIGCKTGTAEFGPANEKGIRKTHAWFTAIVGLPHQENTLSPSPNDDVSASEPVASLSAELTATNSALPVLRKQWQEHLKKINFPQRITITALIESDETNPYKEGSADGGPVVKQIVDWLTQ